MKENQLREEWNKAVPLSREKPSSTEIVADWWISKRTEELTELLGKVKKMKREVEYETQIEGKTRYSRSSEQFNVALSKVESLITSYLE